MPIYNTSQRVREIHVPKDYKTSTGALNKSRALQYCWEDSVNLYSDEEWIVHLDEETLVTEESIKGTFLSEDTFFCHIYKQTNILLAELENLNFGYF